MTDRSEILHKGALLFDELADKATNRTGLSADEVQRARDLAQTILDLRLAWYKVTWDRSTPERQLFTSCHAVLKGEFEAKTEAFRYAARACERLAKPAKPA